MIAATQTNHPLATIKQDTSNLAPLEQAFGQLRAAGLRITQPRIAILRILLEHNQPLSIERIHGSLSDDSCDLVTVYRCLAAFENLGLVRRSFFHNGTSLYEIDLHRTNRYHVVTRNDHHVEPLDEESTAELSAVVKRIEARLLDKGYSEISHVVEFFAADVPAAPRTQSAVRVN